MEPVESLKGERLKKELVVEIFFFLMFVGSENLSLIPALLLFLFTLYFFSPLHIIHSIIYLYVHLNAS